MKIEIGKSYRMTNGRVLTVTALGPGPRLEWTDKAERRKHFKNGSCDRGMFKVWSVELVKEAE